MHDLKGKKFAIVATDGYEQSELEVPLARLKEAGATVDVISLKSETVWNRRPADVGLRLRRGIVIRIRRWGASRRRRG